MAKLREAIGTALLEVEGNADACSWAAGLFHRTLAEQRLREIDRELATLRHERSIVKRFLKGLQRATVEPQSTDAVDPVDGTGQEGPRA